MVVKSTSEEEGVIKFELTLTASTSRLLSLEVLKALTGWRRRLFDRGLIGRDPLRYGGIGYGNVSQRLGGETCHGAPPRFVITGTQTAHIANLEPHHYAIVNLCDPAAGNIHAEGSIAPSSESLTHYTIYCACPSSQFVFHIHSDTIWSKAREMGLPITSPEIAYGTPEMADEVRNVLSHREGLKRPVIVMGGHRGGVLSFGKTAEEAGVAILTELDRALG